MSAFEVCGTARAASFRKSCREQTGVGDYQGAFVLGVSNFEFDGAIRPAGDPIGSPFGVDGIGAGILDCCFKHGCLPRCTQALLIKFPENRSLFVGFR